MHREQTIAFRLNQNNLMKPLPKSQMAQAAGAGVQNTIPGTLALSLGARLKDLTLTDLDVALQKKKTLVEVTGIRGASYVVPSRDYSLFTTAVFSSSEKDLRYLKLKGLSPLEAIETLEEATLKILNHRALSQDEIHEEWRKTLPKKLLSYCRGCGSFHVPYSLVMALGLKGIFCFGPLKEGSTAYVRVDQWLPKGYANRDVEAARRHLIERFLHFYGPATASGFATWAGISTARSLEFWHLLEDELAEISSDHQRQFILKKDLKIYNAASSPKGIILLPPKDAYLNLPDRETVVDKKRIPQVWKILGNPGVIIHDGEIVGLWKSQKKQKTLCAQFEMFNKISGSAKMEAEARVEAAAPLRECEKIRVEWR
jgi:hypothetical protein